MDVSVEFRFNQKVLNGLKIMPDDVLFEIAKQTLDFSISQEIVPIGETQKLIESSAEYGVHRSKGDMTIASTTHYAKYVWNMPQATTHWTNEGKAHNKWYAYTLKKYSQVFINNAIYKSWRKDMQ